MNHDETESSVWVINPGEYGVADRPVVFKTLLGSCVSVCLFDRQRGIGGLNHFLLASPRFPYPANLLDSQAGRYGIQAMELLVNGLMQLGARRNQLRAKVFGGAKVLETTGGDFFQIHKLNQKFALDFLETEGIPAESYDLGGNRGRVIYFNTGTMGVKLRYITEHKTKELEHREHQYFQDQVARPPSGEILFF